MDYVNLVKDGVPKVVADTILLTMPRSVPIDAMSAFVYVKNGTLPPFVLNYFLNMQSRSRTSMTTRFYRALHLIEAFRDEYFQSHPEEQRQLPLPPPRRLPSSAADAFKEAVKASLDRMKETGTFAPVSVERARELLSTFTRTPSATETPGTTSPRPTTSQQASKKELERQTLEKVKDLLSSLETPASRDKEEQPEPERHLSSEQQDEAADEVVYIDDEDDAQPEHDSQNFE